MADPFTEYQKVLASRGLGGVFQEEGPGLGPSARTSAQIKALRQLRDGSVNSGMDERIATPQMNSGILEALRSDQRSKTVAPGDIESAINEVRGLNLESILGSGLGRTPETRSPLTLQEKKARQDSRDTAASRIEAMPEDSSVFKDSSFFDIASQLGKAQINPSLNGANDSEIAQRMIADKKRRLAEEESEAAKEAAALGVDSVIDKKMNKDAIAGLLGDSGSADKNVAVEDAFLGGMSEYYKALAQEVPEVGDRKELLKKYMQEFSEATGIPVGEKVDKSQALMALGLSLMQNRAGSGFNVGKVLNAVGQAGDAAMPYLTKAKDEAKQARIAAGKYALQQIESDEDASDAIVASNTALRQELILKNIDAQNEAKMKVLEARLEGGNASQMPESIYDEEIKIGTNNYKVRMGINPSNLQPVFVNPAMDASEIGTAYKKTVSGLNSISEMEALTVELIEASRGTAGGITARRFLDSAKGVLKSMGLSEEDFFRSKEGKGLSAEDELDAVRRAFIMRFKRFISQETGNGISNVDVQQIEGASGALDSLLSFKNPEKSLVAFKELRKLFDGSLTSLQPMIDGFSNRENYYEGGAGDKLYNRTMEKLSNSLGDSINMQLFNPTMVEGADGSQTATYDVRS